MADLKATPRSSVLGAIADALTRARSVGDKAKIPFTDMGLGELFLGKMPEEVNEWSYGNAPLQVVGRGTGSRVPQIKQGRREQLVDTVFGLQGMAPLAAASTRAVKAIPSAVRHGAQEFAHASAAANPRIIKDKGGNWLAGSVENALSELRRSADSKGTAALLREGIVTPEQVRRVASLDNWIEGALTKYVKRDMATEGDPVRKLAEQGITHAQLGQHSPTFNTTMSRLAKGYPIEGVAKSDVARNWENLSDNAIMGAIKTEWTPETQLKRIDPRVAPEDMVYDYAGEANSLGFKHLTDELANALNPESGLPRQLLLTPEQMQQMGMEKAVRHVDAINKWRAAQQAEANLAKSQSPAVHMVREYAENNPKGLRWTELRQPEAKLEEGWKVVPQGSSGLFEVVDDLGRQRSVGATEQEAVSLLNRTERKQLLADQLKYEGDTMGHCVGGYCDDVLSGRSRIFSLRDAKGQPHVTIEAGPPRTVKHDEVIEELKKNPNFDKMSEQEYTDAYEKALVDLAPSRPARIVQIKGKANLAPKEEYLPFVQDFVKSGKWSDVGDLKNAGMWKNRHTGEYHTLKELEGNAALQDIYASRNLDENGNWIGGYAHGGLVEAEDDFAYPGMF